MKKCRYCGKEYSDEASKCTIDGQPLASFPPEPEPAGGDSRDEVKTAVVRTFSSHEAAELAAANLEAHGITSWITADDCGRMYPNLTAPGGVRLAVYASDAEEAAALLSTQPSPGEMSQIKAEAIAYPPPDTGPLRKLALGQISFGIVFGAILGILLCLFYQSASEFGKKTYYHYRKGKPDEAWVYRNGNLVEFLEDRNLDGKWDHWTYYKHGRAVRSEYDNNFDGKPDEFWTFSADGADTCQSDTDFNGTPDWSSTYQNKIIQETDMRPNGSKFTTVRKIYKNGYSQKLSGVVTATAILRKSCATIHFSIPWAQGQSTPMHLPHLI